ncbi:HalD/BesD family halogenase [Pseudonocardia sp.]|uniref:HalD/BesD family halogenase n=1 Tax=Pseudonocardia sp. TaxID=60912 RepID=UPI003D0BCFA1
MGSSQRPTIERVIDTDRFPVATPGAGRDAVVERVRRDLAVDGCSVLPGFVRPGVRGVLEAEGAAAAGFAHHDVEIVNVYNTDPDPALSPDHPARRTTERGNAFVARDRIPADAVVQHLYTSTALQEFVAACVGLPQVFELADPLAGLTLNVVVPGRGHPWHFDTNEFTVSMVTREPEAGGVFEYCPGIRSADDENLTAVTAVLDGEGGDLVRRLPLRVGDLQIFAGRYSLHRVTAVGGAHARHSAILAYSARPGVVGAVTRTRQLFGRVTPAHTDADRVRVDSLMD